MNRKARLSEFKISICQCLLAMRRFAPVRFVSYHRYSMLQWTAMTLKYGTKLRKGCIYMSALSACVPPTLSIHKSREGNDEEVFRPCKNIGSELETQHSSARCFFGSPLRGCRRREERPRAALRSSASNACQHTLRKLASIHEHGLCLNISDPVSWVLELLLGSLRATQLDSIHWHLRTQMKFQRKSPSHPVSQFVEGHSQNAHQCSAAELSRGKHQLVSGKNFIMDDFWRQYFGLRPSSSSSGAERSSPTHSTHLGQKPSDEDFMLRKMPRGFRNTG